ncbi:MAG: HAD family hydrolase [Natronosporangium sp.]
MRRAVLLDLFNTLVPGGTDIERRTVTMAMAELLGVPPAGYAEAFRRCWPERFVGSLGDLASTVRAVAQRVGGSPSDDQVAAAAALRRRLTAGLLARVSAGTLAELDRLRRDGWLLAVVSNTTPESPDRFRDSPLASRFDTAAFSSELRVAKPDPAIYLAACDALGVPPELCVYVGDGADGELAGAAALGMHPVRTVEHADTDPAWPGPTIGTLADLPDGHISLLSLPRLDDEAADVFDEIAAERATQRPREIDFGE